MYLTRRISLHISNYHSVKQLMELFLSTTEYQEYPIGYGYCLNMFMRTMGFPDGSDGKVKNLPAMQETQVQSLGQEDPLEKGMETHSSILAWKIP